MESRSVADVKSRFAFPWPEWAAWALVLFFWTITSALVWAGMTYLVFRVEDNKLYIGVEW